MKDSKLPIASSVGIATAAVLIGNLGESIKRGELQRAVNEAPTPELQASAQEKLDTFDRKCEAMQNLEMKFYLAAGAFIVIGILAIIGVVCLASLIKIFS
jgi:hypothetical protein